MVKNRRPSQKTLRHRRKGVSLEERRDWIMFSLRARMHVSVSGGQIHTPLERVIQILIQPSTGGDESWTVYRHEKDRQKHGKLVFKKWNTEADLEKFRTLGGKRAPRDWNWNTNVTRKDFPLPARWVRALERTVAEISVPIIAGAVEPLTNETEYTLSLWRNRQESEFSWHTKPPHAWRPIAQAFESLMQGFRQYALAKPLPPAHKLLTSV